MRACPPPNKWAKVQPDRLTPHVVRAKKTRNPVHSYGEPGNTKNGVGVVNSSTKFGVLTHNVSLNHPS